MAKRSVFVSKLLQLGFKLQSRDKDVKVYARLYPEHKSKVEVQLWFDGVHRASHFHHDLTQYGKMDSVPTGFTTVSGMEEAIKFESRRFAAGIPKDFVYVHGMLDTICKVMS